MTWKSCFTENLFFATSPCNFFWNITLMSNKELQLKLPLTTQPVKFRDLFDQINQYSDNSHMMLNELSSSKGKKR